MKKTILILLLLALGFIANAQNWEYSSKMDEMTHEISFFATTISNPNIIPVTSITIKNLGNTNQVILSIESEKFYLEMVKDITYAKVYVKFDDGDIETYYADPAKDNIYNILFLHRANNFIKKLKASKKVLIRAEVSEKGTMTFSFNTSGFQWEY